MSENKTHISYLKAVQSFPVWLPQTQTWLFNQVRFLPENIKSHIICKSTQNLDQFNLKNIHSLMGPSSRLSDLSTRLLRHIDFHLYTLQKVRSLRPDIVHSHFGPVAWKNHLVLKFLRNKKPAHIVTFYGQDVDHLPKIKPAWKQRYRELFSHIDLVLCEGPHMANKIKLAGCPDDKVLVHRLGIDLSQIPYHVRSFIPEEPLRILLAAAFREKKGLIYALRALEKIADTVPLRLTLVGDHTSDLASINEKEKIIRFINGSKLSHLTDIKGFIPQHELNSLAQSHHIYIAPSITANDGDNEGGAPVSLIEMAASGMPVISSRHCDIPEVIKDHHSGLLVEEKSPDDIERAIHTLLQQPGLWASLARNARSHIETHFNAITQGEKLADIYSAVGHTTTKRTNSYPPPSPAQTKSPKKILFISHSASLYGAERSLADLLCSLHKTDEYDILVLLPSDGPLKKHLDHFGIDTKIVPVIRWTGKRFRFAARFYRSIMRKRTLKQALSAVIAFSPDLIYTNTLATPLGATLKKEFFPYIPHIWHARELPGHPDFGFFDIKEKKAWKMVDHYSDIILCNSRFLADQIKNKLRFISQTPSVKTIYNGFSIADQAPPESAHKKPPSRYQLVMAGSISPLKNYTDAIRAVHGLYQDGIPICLKIYGEGTPSAKKWLQNEINKCQLQHVVTLEGYQQPEIIFSEAHIHLICSKIETFGRTAVEALLNNCPVISADTGGLSEIIHHQKTGLLYSPGDVPTLKKHILCLIENPEIREQLTDEGRSYCRNTFGLDLHVKAVKMVIDEMTQERMTL